MKSANCQQVVRPKLSRTQRQLLRQIAHYGRVEGAFIGLGPIRSVQYARFDSLRRLSTLEQMLYFATLRSPAVKVYAYGELLKQGRLQKACSLMQANLRDNRRIESQNGCIVFIGTINRLMYRKLRLAFSGAGKLATENQRAQLEAMLKELPAEDY